MAVQSASGPADMLSKLEHMVVQKFADPCEDLSELEWYALQSIITRRTQDDSVPPIKMLKAAKDQSKLSPLGGLDMPAWFEWCTAHPLNKSRTSLTDFSNVANQDDSHQAEGEIAMSETPSQPAPKKEKPERPTPLITDTITDRTAGFSASANRKRKADSSGAEPSKAARLDSRPSRPAAVSSLMAEPASSRPEHSGATTTKSNNATASSRPRAQRLTTRSPTSQAPTSSSAATSGPSAFLNASLPSTPQDCLRKWQLTNLPVAYEEVQEAIRNKIGVAPDIEVLKRCRAGTETNLGPLDTMDWTLWRYGICLDKCITRLTEMEGDKVEAGVKRLLKALLSLDDPYIDRLLLSVLSMVPIDSRRRLKRALKHKMGPETQLLDFSYLDIKLL